jgi:hypothetical protein
VAVPRSAASGEGSDLVVRCAECGLGADERWTIIERWSWWSDGCGTLVPFCPECAERKFGHRIEFNRATA